MPEWAVRVAPVGILLVVLGMIGLGFWQEERSKRRRRACPRSRDDFDNLACHVQRDLERRMD